jgi:cytochrome c peroxidase
LSENMGVVNMKAAKVLLLGLVFVTSCSNNAPEQPAAPAATPAAEPAPPPDPLGTMNVPADNAITPEKVALGKQLFFDTRLSKTGMMSCETCHLPDKGWTDGKALSTKFDGSVNTRHTPTLYNVGYYNQWYWDGRAATLEGQVTAAWRGQMGGDPDAMAATINGVEGYKSAFQTAFGGPATGANIAQALATFVRTIKSENSAWDRYEKGDKTAVAQDVIDGFDVFSNTEKANCTLCHLPPLYTDTLFHNIGVGFDKPMPDQGRGKILADAATAKNTTDPDAAKMMGAFKTPTVRSITESGPYFHNGSSGTLDQAVDFVLKGGTPNPNLDEKLKPRTISSEDRAKLMAFLKALTPEATPFEKPTLP